MEGTMLVVASYLAENARPIYAGIAAYVGQHLGEGAQLTGAPWAERLRLLDEGGVDVAFLCGLPYSRRLDRLELLGAPVMAAPRYRGRPVYFTDVIVRRDSPVRSFEELRDRTWAYNDGDSNSGYVVPRDYLLALGETRGFFGEVIASGSHQQSIRLVLDGKVDASGIDSTVLELEQAQHPDVARGLRVVESIGPCPVPPVVVAARRPEALKARLREALLAMHEDPDGRAILTGGLIDRFVPVQDADYDPIRAMLRRADAAGFHVLR
jgi:ABC-type phosphate/phosphonate transport system substrate-binding protein